MLKTHADQFARSLRHIDRGDPRALHRARVASRRLRELLPVLPLPSGTARKLTRRLRKITARLGEVREFDVLLLLIDELRGTRRRHSGALARVAVAVSHDRDRSRGRRPKDLPVDDLRRTARKLGDLADDLDGDKPRAVKATQWAVDARIARRATRLADSLREAGAVYLPERLHDVRIAVKKLRYSIELGEAVGKRIDPAALRALKRAQDALGRMRDMQVLIDRVRQVQATLTPPNVGVWRSLDALVASIDDDCRRLHARYMRLRPELDRIVERKPSEPRRRVG